MQDLEDTVHVLNAEVRGTTSCSPLPTRSLIDICGS